MPKKTLTLAKLSRPRLYDALPRERLFRMLDEKRKHPAIWISGPPGSGKTTLVGSYLEVAKLPSIWYQVDTGDADPATFFYYLGLAAKASQRGKSNPLPLFTSEYLSDLEGFSRRYFRDLFARLSADFILVFDNYQEVRDQGDFDRIMVEALGQVPHGVNVVLVSRSDPPAAFARCISAEVVTVIGWPDLRLTLDEATAICSDQSHA